MDKACEKYHKNIQLRRECMSQFKRYCSKNETKKKRES